jgi:hypothetical protein
MKRQRCEVWTRVMGYMRPKSFFNLGKKSECNERKYFKEPSDNIMANEDFKERYNK